MIVERRALIVWLHDIKQSKGLERFGSLHFVSRKLRYAVIYLNADRIEATMQQLEKLSFVRKVEHSYRGDIKTEYSSNMPDQTRSYTFT
jgi:uncharacterized protein YlbG (UPF0298 family)